MATIEFTGKDLTVRFEEEPRNGREFQYRIRYECANDTVTHYVKAEGTEQYTKPDGMRGYKDVLTFEENLKAGLTRSPKVYLSTMDGAGNWSAELEIDALNPAPDVPPMSYYNGYDMVAFRFTKPDDTDWAGFCVWADTQNPVRKDQVTSKYIGPNNEASLSLLPDTDYWITYAAYDAFGTDLLQEATIQIHTLSEESILLPTLNERLEAIAALHVKSSIAFLKVANAYSNNNHRAIEELKDYVHSDGTLVSQKLLILETRVGDAESILQLEQQTRANADEALSQSIQLQGARLGAAEAAIVSESTARATQDTALAQQLTQLAARVGTNEAQYSIDITNLVNKDAALSQRIDLQAAQWNSDINAASQSIRTAFANADGALSQRIDTLSAQVGAGGWTAALQSEQTTRANADSALGQRIDTITAGYNGQFVTIQQTMTAQGNTLSGLSAQYTLRIDNAGRVSGFGLASDPYGNSEFAVNVDRFLIAHPGSAERIFEVVSGQVRIRQAVIDRATINGAQIYDLTIGTNKIALNSVTVTHFAQRTSAMYGNGTYYDALSYTVNAPYECDLNIWVSASQGFPNGDRTWNGRLLVNGNQIGAGGGQKTADTFSLVGYAHVGPGQHNVLIRWQGSSSVTLAELKVMILETRR